MSDERIQAQLLDGCLDPNTACRDLILELGGSEAAADFYERTDTFLVALYAAGPVQVAFVSGPLGANYVSSPFIVGGEPNGP